MKEYQRKGLLERLDRDGATVGARIPEQIELDGEEVPLRQVVFEAGPRERLSSGERERLDRLRRALRRARADRRRRIEADEVGYETAQWLVAEALGIDRALTALGGNDGVGIEETAALQEAADRKRWLSFLDRVRGKEGRGRPR